MRAAPVCALVGALRVRETDVDVADTLWTRWGASTGLERDEYDTYLAGSSLPCAIVVDTVARFSRPVGLRELRRRERAFVTPQSYRFVSQRELASLMNGQVGQLERLASVLET